MSRKSQQTIGSNVDIPATTEFEEFAFRESMASCRLTLWKQSSGNFQNRTPGQHHHLISTNSQGG
jgi:hypothetical protein